MSAIEARQMKQKVRVIGAGVAGLVTAYSLAKRGAQVSLYEKAQGLGAQSCSWWAGGMLAPYCERESAEEPVITYAQEAFDFWAEVAPDYQNNGSLVVASARDKTELERFARRTRNHQWLDQAALSKLEPDAGSGFSKALFFADEAHLTPRLALSHMIDAIKDMGGALHFGADGYVNLAQNEKIIDCTGLQARKNIADLRGVRGEMLHLKCEALTLSRPVRLLHPRIPLYIVPRGNGVFMVGATMIESAAKTAGTVRSVVELLNAAYAFNSAFSEAEVLEIGADVRPALPDNLPKVIEADDRLYINGMYRHGYLLMPALARAACDLVLKNQRDEDLIIGMRL
jgi:glycine oxidase